MPYYQHGSSADGVDRALRDRMQCTRVAADELASIDDTRRGCYMAASLDQYCRSITEDHAPVWTDLGESDEREQSIATTDIEHFSILQSRGAQYPIADSFELSM